MLLALWPALIAMPETANYALLDQQKRDERRLAARKKLIEDELARRRNVSTGDGSVYTGLDTGATDGGNIDEQSSIGNDILRYDATAGAGRDGLPSLSLGVNAESGLIQDGIDKAMKRRNDDAFILILANL